MGFPLRTYELKNGIRLVHLPNGSDVAHFGLLVHTGTRDELREEHGLAHFMEHMFFKGTLKRSPFQIISRLEDTGGEINAYTTKEETAIYASFLRQDYRKAIELIQDLFLYSRFPEKEREREIEVVLSEIQNYEDTPSELIFDRAEEMLYPDHPIGRNILGSQESLSGFGNGSLERFRLENYATGEIVLASVGSVPFDRVRYTVEKYFSEIPLKTRQRTRSKPRARSAKKIVAERNLFQKHCILISEAYSLPHPRRLHLYLLNNILGGPGMNSKLNLALRERRGLSYSAESHYAPYTDTGAMMIYFSCDGEKLGRCLQVTREELKKLMTKPITDKRLEHARMQMLGQLAIGYENKEHLMMSMAKNFLIFNRMESLDSIREKLGNITARQLMETANEVLHPDQLNMLVFE
ncbi:MAG: pitrilysin family protein [Bacteroidales bacterium]